MSKGKSDHLFQLVKSMKKSEKRYFKLFAGDDGPGENKKFLLLFEEIDRQDAFNEERILQKIPSIKPEQLSNLKSHLYKRILQSLRQYHTAKVPEVSIREHIDFAQVLFNRCLYAQCAKTLQKAKKQAQEHNSLELLLEIYRWEKIVLAQTIGRGNQHRVNKIVSEVQDVNNRINNINTFTNLSARLNAFYLKAGFIRNQHDYDTISQFLTNNLPNYEESQLSFNEKLHLYDLLVNYYFFIQDFEKGYEYAKKWVALFDLSKDYVISRLEMYIKGINNLMIAQYKLYAYVEFVETQKKLRSIKHLPGIELNENIQTKLFKYHYVHEFNRYFMLGDFDMGVSHFNRIKSNMEEYITRLDKHSRIIMYYKIACLYFGNDNYREVIFWLNKIFTAPDPDLREDIHSFARILNLISHYELGNNDVLEYYLKSTYRFLLKKDDLHLYQKTILNFMKKLNRSITETQLLSQFENLLNQLLPLTQSRYEKRAFMYFDIISWLEAKLQKKRVQEVIKAKAAKIITGQKAA